MSKFVYVLVAEIDYEGSNVIGVKSTEALAKEFIAKVADYAKLEPQFVRGESYSAYQTLKKAWNKDHPAGSDYYADSYDYVKMPLI